VKITIVGVITSRRDLHLSNFAFKGTRFCRKVGTRSSVTSLRPLHLGMIYIYIYIYIYIDVASLNATFQEAIPQIWE